MHRVSPLLSSNWMDTPGWPGQLPQCEMTSFLAFNTEAWNSQNRKAAKHALVLTVSDGPPTGCARELPWHRLPHERRGRTSTGMRPACQVRFREGGVGKLKITYPRASEQQVLNTVMTSHECIQHRSLEFTKPESRKTRTCFDSVGWTSYRLCQGASLAQTSQLQLGVPSAKEFL